MYFCQQARYIITIVFPVLYSQAYYLSQTEASWQNSTCSMATPEFGSKPDEYLIKDNHLLTPNMTSVWIGFYQVLVGFEYIGCVKESEIVDLSEVTKQPIKGDPGHCFLGCSNATIIGVSDTMCYCLNKNNYNISQSDSNQCTSACSLLQNVACGGPMGHLSVYKPNADVTKKELQIARTETSDPKMCLSFDPVERYYQWDNCMAPLFSVCLHGDTIANISLSPWYTYISASNACFKLGLKPVPYSNPPNLQTRLTGMFWTGIFKTTATFKRQDAPAGVDFYRADMKYGMLEYKTWTQKKYVHFVEEDDIIRKSLCNRLHTHVTYGSLASLLEHAIIPLGICFAFSFFVAIMIKRRNQLRTTDINTRNDNNTPNQNHADVIVDQPELEQTGNACNADHNYSDAATSTITRTVNGADDSTNEYPDKPLTYMSKYNVDDDMHDIMEETQESSDEINEKTSPAQDYTDSPIG